MLIQMACVGIVQLITGRLEVRWVIEAERVYVALLNVCLGGRKNLYTDAGAKPR